MAAFHVASAYLYEIGQHPYHCVRRALDYVMTTENLVSKIGSFDITEWYRTAPEKLTTTAVFEDLPTDDQALIKSVIQRFINPNMETFDMKEVCAESLRLSNTLSSKILKIEEVEIEFNETIERFYKYLKVNYGTGEKTTYGEPSLICSSGIKIPGFRQNSPEHKWQVHLESIGDYDCLIVGESMPSSGRTWSRVFSVKIQHDGSNDGYKTHWFEVVENMFFKKGFDFETLRVFTKICETFFAEVPIETPVES